MSDSPPPQYNTVERLSRTIPQKISPIGQYRAVQRTIIARMRQTMSDTLGHLAPAKRQHMVGIQGRMCDFGVPDAIAWAPTVLLAMNSCLTIEEVDALFRHHPPQTCDIEMFFETLHTAFLRHVQSDEEFRRHVEETIRRAFPEITSEGMELLCTQPWDTLAHLVEATHGSSPWHRVMGFYQGWIHVWFAMTYRIAREHIISGS